MNFKFKTAVITAISMGALIVASAQTATTVSCFQFTKNLKLGSSGAQVLQLQKSLNSDGYTVATAGVGSAGNETSYFGAATKRAVIKFQSANSLPATGNVFALTRAVLNACPAGSPATGTGTGTGTSSTTVSTVSGPVTVSLATAQPNNVLVAGSARNTIANLVFSGNGTVSGIVLQRTGVSNNTSVNNVYLLDQDTNTVIGGLSASVTTNGTVTFNNPSGLFMVSGTKHIAVLVDLASMVNGVSISGQSIGFALSSFSTLGNPAAIVSGINGPSLPVSSATLASVQIGAITNVGTGMNAGTPNASLWRAPVTVSTNNVTFGGITFTAIGSVPTNAFANYRLYVDGNQVGNAVSMDGNMRVAFSFTPMILQTGGHTVELRADNVSGTGRSVNFVINSSGDALFQDSNVGAYVSLTSTFSGGVQTACSSFWSLSCGESPTITIGQGSIAVTADSTWNPSTIVGGASNQDIAKFIVNTYGEDQKVYTFTVTPTASNLSYTGGSTSVLNNLALFINGAQVGSTITQATAGSPYTFNQTYVFPASSTSSIEVRVDTNTTVGSATYAITGGTVGATIAGTSYGNGVNGANASGSSNPFNGASNGSMTIGTAQGSIGVTGATNKTISPNQSAQNIGSFIFQNGNSEAVTLNQVSIGAVASYSGDSLQNYKNVTLQMVNGSSVTNVGTPYPYAASTMSWNPSLNVPANSSVTFNLIADVGSTPSGANIVVTPAVQYTGISSNVVTSKTSGSSITNYVNLAVLNAPTIAGDTPVSQFVVGGSTVTTGNFNLSVSSGNTTVNEIKFAVNTNNTNGSTAAQSAVQSVTVAGINAAVVNGVADVTGLSIPVSSSNNDLPVSITTTCFGGTGNCNQSSLTNNAVYLSITYVKSNQSGVAPYTANSNVVVANPLYIVASKPTVVQTSGYTGSTGLNGGTQVLAAYTVSADAAGAINLKNIAFTTSISTSGTANVTNLMLCTNTSCSANVGGATNATTSAVANASTNYAFNFASPYTIGSGSTVTFYVLGNVQGTFGNAGATSINTQLSNASTFAWTENIGISPTTQSGVGIVNYPLGSYSLHN